MDGEGDVNKEGGVGQNGSFKGRSRWSQVVARIRLAGGGGLPPEKRFLFLPTPLPIHPVFSLAKLYIFGRCNPEVIQLSFYHSI